MRILLVEDESRLAAVIQEGLEAEQMEVLWSETGEEGFFLAKTEQLDLILLDLMLPGRNGLEILAALRDDAINLPVIIITARDAVDDRVRGLDAGADDYLVKPFALSELVARIRAVSRRGRVEQAPLLHYDELELDRIRQTATRANQVLSLTALEYRLLDYFVLHADETVSREMLARDVWDGAQRATPLDNVIDVHIARLRAKMDTPFDYPLLHTIRGLGFRISREKP